MSNLETANSATPPFRLIPFNELKRNYGIQYCRQHLRDLEREGKFPKRVHLSPKRVAWRSTDLDAFLQGL